MVVVVCPRWSPGWDSSFLFRCILIFGRSFPKLWCWFIVCSLYVAFPLHSLFAAVAQVPLVIGTNYFSYISSSLPMVWSLARFILTFPKLAMMIIKDGLDIHTRLSWPTRKHDFSHDFMRSYTFFHLLVWWRVLVSPTLMLTVLAK